MRFLLIATGMIFIRFSEVNGSSMEPGMENGDILATSVFGTVKNGQEVCIYSEEYDTVLVKRIIGIPGDHIVINNSGLYINEELLDEAYVKTEDWDKAALDLYVPEGYVYVMGDNRDGSMDSREFGCLPEENIEGSVITDITRLCGLHKTGVTIIIYIFLFGPETVKIVIKFLRNGNTGETDHASE